MHYSPRIWPERDPELRLIFLSLSPPAGPRPPVAAGLLAAHDRPSRTGGGSSHWHSSSRARASLTRIQHSTVPLRTRRDGSGQRSAYHRFRRRKPAPPCPKRHRMDPRSLRWHASSSSWRTHSACLNVRLPMAALKTLPVRFLRSLQYRRLHWVQPRHTSSSSLSVRHRSRRSTGRLCRQVRVLLAKEPFKVRKPARLERRGPTTPL